MWHQFYNNRNFTCISDVSQKRLFYIQQILAIIDGLNRMCRIKLFQTFLSFVFLEVWKYKDKKLMASGVYFLNYNIGDRF